MKMDTAPATTDTMARLARDGWALSSEPCRSREAAATKLLNIAEQIGEPVRSLPTRPLVEWLTTAPERSVRPNLTSWHGAGAFPLHCDTAHWPVPARYICLMCLEPGEAVRATLLWPFQRDAFSGSQLRSLETEPFLFVTGRTSFYSTVLSRTRPFVRVDLGCMRPVSTRGEDLLESLRGVLAAASPLRVRWCRGGLLLLDNWRTLHGRDAAEVSDRSRLIARTLVRTAR